MVDVRDEAAAAELRIVEQVFAALDDAAGHAVRWRLCISFVWVVAAGPGGDQLVQLGELAAAVGERGEA